MEKKAALGKNREFTLINVEHRQDFVKDKVQWLNQKQETGYWSWWKYYTDGRK